MRCRSLLAVATVGILLVSGCSAAAPDSSDGSATTASAAALEREPHSVDTQLPTADLTSLWLPLTFLDMQILDPGWDTEAHYGDGVFLGAAELGDRLEYSAVDVHGSVLWAAERPTGSTDFSVRVEADGSAIAVLPDSGPDGSATVSAYDLVTGEQVWGPVEPPGPEASATEEGPAGEGAAMSEGEVHVDQTTGATVTLHDTTLRAEDPAGAELWTLSIDEGTRLVGLAGGLLYLRDGDAIRAHNVMTGAVAQAYDPAGEGRVVVPQLMVSMGAALLLDGERPLIATAPQAPPDMSEQETDPVG